MTDSEQTVQPIALSKWMPRVLIALTLVALGGFNVIANPLGFAVDGDGMSRVLQEMILAGGMGIITAQPVLLMIWVMWSDSAPSMRISWGLLALLLTVATIAYGVFIVETRVNTEVIDFPVLIAFQAVALAVPLALFRRFTRWRLQSAAGNANAAAAPSQFSIKAMLIWTFEVGLLVTLFQFLYRHLPEEEGRNWSSQDASWLLMMMLGGLLMSLPVIAAAWLFLGRGRTVIVGAVMTILMLALSGGIAIGLTVGGGGSLEDLLPIAAILGGAIVTSTFVYVVLRALGYRMVRIEKTLNPAAATCAVPAGPEVNRERSRFQLGWQFAVAMLMVLAARTSIGWRAKETIPQRRRDAEQAYLRHLGFSVQLEGNTIVGLAPLNANQKFDEAHLEAINALDPVPTLNLAGVANPSRYLQVLWRVKNARSLFLYQSGVTDADMALVGHMPTLEVLNISRTKVSDAGLAELAELKNLQQLVASSTAITDAGLEKLHGLKSLIHIELYSTGVTAEGVKKLQEALPKVSVRWE